ncbi:LacI family DNA-binding transcriptional regulator [Catellatospora sichuanensis]|uniref:LacI family DNA-binding transcriptional regulator n=1 Tax=Catellatospora sichuanensis TaxID=1969805 RepID=UPI00118326B7|nr:LacI family DNA-binding transcriptional regulator [Catellatospora sichuanensis]
MVGDGTTTRLLPSRARLLDVARLAGVSVKTVSRVVTGHQNVSKHTRERVTQAAQQLRFRPNHLARDLRQGGVSRTMAFVIGDLTNPFYAQVAAGVEQGLADEGLTMVIAVTHDDPAQEARVVSTMLERRVHSLLLVPIAADQSYLAGELQLGTPIICLDRPAQNLAADSVVIANRAGATDAVRSLLAHGHRRIAFIGSTVYTNDERLAGYRQALFDFGVAAVTEWERTDAVTAADADRATRELLAAPVTPTAILAGDNRISTGVLRALRDTQREVALIGFDDFDLAETLSITVVSHDAGQMGREAVRLALARHEDLSGPPMQSVIPARLTLRGSGETPPPRSRLY